MGRVFRRKVDRRLFRCRDADDLVSGVAYDIGDIEGDDSFGVLSCAFARSEFGGDSVNIVVIYKPLTEGTHSAQLTLMTTSATNQAHPAKPGRKKQEPHRQGLLRIVNYIVRFMYRTACL